MVGQVPGPGFSFFSFIISKSIIHFISPFYFPNIIPPLALFTTLPLPSPCSAIGYFPGCI
jgi:hypothetical protein